MNNLFHGDSNVTQKTLHPTWTFPPVSQRIKHEDWSDVSRTARHWSSSTQKLSHADWSIRGSDSSLFRSTNLWLDSIRSIELSQWSLLYYDIEHHGKPFGTCRYDNLLRLRTTGVATFSSNWFSFLTLVFSLRFVSLYNGNWLTRVREYRTTPSRIRRFDSIEETSRFSRFSSKRTKNFFRRRQLF